MNWDGMPLNDDLSWPEILAVAASLIVAALWWWWDKRERRRQADARALAAAEAEGRRGALRRRLFAQQADRDNDARWIQVFDLAWDLGAGDDAAVEAEFQELAVALRLKIK